MIFRELIQPGLVFAGAAVLTAVVLLDRERGRRELVDAAHVEALTEDWSRTTYRRQRDLHLTHPGAELLRPNPLAPDVGL